MSTRLQPITAIHADTMRAALIIIDALKDAEKQLMAHPMTSSYNVHAITLFIDEMPVADIVWHEDDWCLARIEVADPT